MDIPMTGRCQCGAITYTLRAEPVFNYACHCGSCQKRTGSAFSMGLVVPTEALEVEGDLTPWTRRSDKGQTNTRYSCAACGNIIYGVGEANPELAKLQPGTLDDTSDVEPDVHIWTSRKQPWLSLPEGAPDFPTEPADPAELLQAALAYRSVK